MPDFSMPSFEGADGELWLWDSSSESYQKAKGNAMIPDRNHASGGDNNLFDPASTQDGNYFKPGNPLQEGIMAHTGALQCGQMVMYYPTGGSLGDDRPQQVRVLYQVGDRVQVKTQGGLILTVPQINLSATPNYPPIGTAETSDSPEQIDRLVQGGQHEAYDWAAGAGLVSMGVAALLKKVAEMQQQKADQRLVQKYFERRARYDLERMGLSPEEIEQAINEAWGRVPQQDLRLRDTYDNADWSRVPEKYHVAGLPQHAEDCMCPDCERFRQEMSQTPIQDHQVHPFPDRVVKPNRFKQDNSFPSMISSTNDQRNTMDYSHLPTWQDQIEKAAASLDSCPDCGDSMFETSGEKACHGCGTRQPVIYTQAAEKTAGPLIAVPIAEGLAEGAALGVGADAAAAGAVGDAAGTASRAGILMNKAMGDKGEQGESGGGGAPPSAQPGAEEQGTVSHLRDAVAMVNWGLQYYGFADQVLAAGYGDPEPYLCHCGGQIDQQGFCPNCGADHNGDGGEDYWRNREMGAGELPPEEDPFTIWPGRHPMGHVGGTFGEEETGTATKNDGLDSNPANKETQGFNEEHGGSPELTQDTNDVGGSASPYDSMMIFEMLIPHVVQPHIEHGGTGQADPMMLALDQLLESQYPGYRDGTKPMELQVSDPNAQGGDGEAADGKDDEENKDEPENAPKAAAAGKGHASDCGCNFCSNAGKLPGSSDEEDDDVDGITIEAGAAAMAPNGMGMGFPMGDPMNAGGPCPICGMDDCVHKRGQQGNALPNPMQTQQHPPSYQAKRKVSVRRPKMCPFHTELVDWSLQFGDPEKAMNLMSSHMFSDKSCKGGHAGTCNFKPQMATQSYWDQKEQEALQRAQERMGPTPVTQDIPDLGPIHEEGDYEPPTSQRPQAPAPDTEPWDGGGHHSEIGNLTAVGQPMTAGAMGMEPPPGDSVHHQPPQPGYADRENAQVQQWRVEQFQQLGFTPEKAHELALSGIDTHALRSLIDQGATPDLAQQIMSRVSAEESDEDEGKDCARCGNKMEAGAGSCSFCKASPERARYESKWHVADVHGMPHHEVEPHHEMAQGNWQDSMGQALQEGGDYELKSPNYEIPDHITVKAMTPDTLHVVIHGEMGMDYGDQITQQDMANEQYAFEPVQQVGMDSDNTPVAPSTDSAPMDQGMAGGPQVDDLSRAAAMTLYSGSMEEMSPEARAHFASIQAMEGGANDPTAEDRSWLMDGDGGMDVDPATLAKVAGRDYTPREQREFIDEDGEARNLDQLDLEGTHYPDSKSIENDFLW